MVDLHIEKLEKKKKHLTEYIEDLYYELLEYLDKIQEYNKKNGDKKIENVDKNLLISTFSGIKNLKLQLFNSSDEPDK